MAIKFRSSWDAFIAYSTAIAMSIGLWKVERHTDTLILLLYYIDFIYIAQYVCTKLKGFWEDSDGENDDQATDNDGNVTILESLPLVTTPLSLLPFHTVFRLGLDRGYLYQFICFLRLVSLYQERRIHFDFEDKKTASSIKCDHLKEVKVPVQPQERTPQREVDRKTQKLCHCTCRFEDENIFEE